MFFFGLSAILVAIYDWNFRILQTINEYQKRTQQGKLVRNFFKFSLINGEEDEKNISESDLSFASNSLLKAGAFSSLPCKLTPGNE